MGQVSQESSHSGEEDDQVFDKLEHSRPEETTYSENKVEELGQVSQESRHSEEEDDQVFDKLDMRKQHTLRIKLKN